MEKCVELKDIYTKVSIEMGLPKPCKSIKIPLRSYEEIFTKKTEDGHFYKRILLTGQAGFGKTTTTAKVAHEWSKGDDSQLPDIPLLFVINMRWVDHTTNLEDAIFSQILPDDTEMTKDELQKKMKALEDRVVIILDAVDESDRELFSHPQNSGSIVKLLRGEILVSCKLIVTSRPWRVKEITKHCKAFTRLDLGGFSKEDVKTYIKQFFKDDEELGESLLEYLSQNAVVADVSSVPLMALLVCTYWRETRASEIPNRIGHLYDAIFGIMYQHFQSKPEKPQTEARETRAKKFLRFLKLTKVTSQKESVVDFTVLLQHLGKMALNGLWPPENQIVFSSDDIDDPEALEEACQMGLVSKEEIRTGHLQSLIASRDATVRTSSNVTTKVSFFHKSAQEKCAGEYLAYLAKNNPKKVQSRLKSLTTLDDALSIQLVLRFACGQNSKAAYGILQRLGKVIWKSVSSAVEDYYDEALDLDESLKIQQFQELCLSCNYEADCKQRFGSFLEDVFPEGRIYFLGILATTALTLGYFMQHCSQSAALKSLTLRPISHPGDYVWPTGPLGRLYAKNQTTIKEIPRRKLKEICQDFLNTYKGDVSPHVLFGAKRTPAMILGQIQLWQACEDIPTPDETNVKPIVDTLQYTTLETFDMTAFKMRENIEIVVEASEKGHMSNLKILNLSNIGMKPHQTERLAKSFKNMPNLEVIDVSRNESGRAMEYMAETFPDMTSLDGLVICDMNASTEQMCLFAKQFPQFGLRLDVLHIDGNQMDDDVASTLESHLPLAIGMISLSVSVHNLSRRHHNQLLLTLRHLEHLQQVLIYNSQYPDDLLVTTADVMGSLKDLKDLTLEVHPSTRPEISTASWKYFKSKLIQVPGLETLYLQGIALEKDDFMEFVDLCLEKKYRTVRYNINYVPDDARVPEDDIFEFP